MTIVSFANCQSDRVHDIWRSGYHPLDAIFSPKTIAVIGATERDGSVGRTVLWNLMSHPFGGTIFPVNPQRPSVLGIKAYPTIADVPEAVDLAIIATPAPTVPDLVGECVDANVKGVIILSAGFREVGSAGVELEQQIRAHLKRGQLRLIGPNCLGVMNPHLGLNATFANSIAKPGKVGFISQSGALCSAILDWSFHENVGFSSFISIGSMLDVDWGDLIYYLGDDPHTESIVIYMESIGDPRSFLSAAREVALTKPIIVIKAGRTEAAAKAATSHTGAMAGSDDVFNAALRRCGVLRVDSISDLFDMAEVLAKQPRPKGSRLTIITNAGGPGVLATDALVTNGGTLAELSPETIKALNQHLPAHWSHHNPIDILGDAEPERYAKALEIAAQDPNSDGLLVILTPQAMTDPTRTAQQLQSYSQLGKPILTSWMGNSEIAAGAELLNQAKIPTFAYPDTAARLFNYMWRYSYNLRGIYETPTLAEAETVNRLEIEQIIQNARTARRTLLTEFESKQFLAAYGIPTVETQVARSAEAAVQVAEKLGYPVVLKLYSETITHKTDVGGVQLNLLNAEAVREAYQAIAATVLQRTQDSQAFLGVTVQPMIQREGYELIIGSSLDPQFGSVMLFGSGGQLVEVYRDRAIALPPLNTTLARRMMEQTHIYRALQGVRGRKAVDLAALEQLLVRFSQLVVEQRWIKEIEINPLLASADKLLALDARIVLHDPDVTEAELPKLAVRPYPSQFTWKYKLSDQKEVTIRPIRPEDEPLLIQFHQTLSEESVYFRYFHMIGLKQRIAHERLTRLCFIDYDRELALVAERKDAQTGASEILAIARLSKLHATNDAEFGMMVNDRYQRQGLGTMLLNCLLKVGRHEHLERIRAEILCENRAMQRVCEKLGFQLRRDAEEGVMKAEISFTIDE
ncbi:bifunctional acetate--CoA ligase family protein/GNAT family N-acetyltransferase [Leptolyngbya sp. GGD]|uniref:bifunctional acetate--CoA ligase family protein/GNAT family N-acetyltransferase n=1 Tax=Leptolyngbya sp. GGD TaxID=2997907 RepID=UPI00227CC284|nr:bifunctional acetate--CoA ligase family protein/GNAT family N-acetyltransferase [Leptolyngbya sp. GGD]MCY6493727.1 bifunctional acetate--CoA ligase family protein/GNAT family N-acetyltransferase [Leptolyngbya sp. GGD]